MSQNSTHQMEPSASVSASPSAGDLTEQRATMESALHTEAAGLSHLPGPRLHSAGGASYVGGEGTRKTPFLSAGTISRNGAERNWGLKYGTERIRNDRIRIGGPPRTAIQVLR